MLTALSHLDPAYFWDVEIISLDEQRSKRLIIERVFSRGTLEEIKRIEDFYGKEVIVSTLTHLAFLDAKTLNFVAVIYSIPKAKFRCYRHRQSIKKSWS